MSGLALTEYDICLSRQEHGAGPVRERGDRQKTGVPRPDRHRDGFSRPSPLPAHGTKARHIKYVPGFFEKNAMLSDPKRYGEKVDFFVMFAVKIFLLRS